ncbi:HlyD family type I secretion periplasmic adaptor subunit [Campylobacter sp. RM16192]|uniref:HlyD family type I secretion periplasmic adaptor subunit n=1 Tax=Campylobacter sp. RM16192 TaxID=1660080 RepID=UPI0014514E09|nr:HlyD family type I secretion periplasmic adaptor subunit [Campylobacter sp. RM16192]QCD51749.1 type I secretion system, membrane fusion protein, HlyD family [Campylobacter sp. RM16192]
MKNRQDDTHEFKPLLIEIEDRPLNPLGRVILYLMMAVIVFGTSWLILAKVDVVVSAQGKVIPSGEIKILKPLESGVVSKIFVKDGDKVKKGDILIQIDPTVTDASLSNKQDDLKVINSDILLFNALINEQELSKEELANLNISQLNLYTSQKEILKNTYESNEAKIEAANLDIKTQKAELSRVKLLLSKEEATKKRLQSVLDIIAKKEYDEVNKNIINLTEQNSMAKFKLDEADKKLKEIKEQSKTLIKELKSKWIETSLSKERERRELSAQIDAILFSNKTQQIKSPTDGYVGKLLIHTEGGVVNPNDNLISIIPSDVPLVIKSSVLNKDIGFLKVGQEVAIKIDTFSFQKYGLLQGVITHVSNDAIEDEKLGLIYEIQVKPKSLEIKVDGEMKKLDIGMSVITEVKVGKRRVIELFIYPIIKYLDEGLSVR